MARGNVKSGVGESLDRDDCKKSRGKLRTFKMYVCICNYMPSHTERIERLKILKQKQGAMIESGDSQVLQMKLLEDYMKQIWYLGHQTRRDYLSVLFP